VTDGAFTQADIAAEIVPHCLGNSFPGSAVELVDHAFEDPRVEVASLRPVNVEPDFFVSRSIEDDILDALRQLAEGVLISNPSDRRGTGAFDDSRENCGRPKEPPPLPDRQARPYDKILVEEHLRAETVALRQAP